MNVPILSLAFQTLPCFLRDKKEIRVRFIKIFITDKTFPRKSNFDMLKRRQRKSELRKSLINCDNSNNSRWLFFFPPRKQFSPRASLLAGERVRVYFCGVPSLLTPRVTLHYLTELLETPNKADIVKLGNKVLFSNQTINPTFV